MTDYFSPPATPEEAVLRRIKGNYRMRLVLQAIAEDGIASVPAAWKEHSLAEELKGFLGRRDPRSRAGEDLPDLRPGEVEIARISLLRTARGEVTSLRAAPGTTSATITFTFADELGTAIAPPTTHADAPLSSPQIVVMFRDAQPSPTATPSKFTFQSFFYPDLNEVAAGMGIFPAS